MSGISPLNHAMTHSDACVESYAYGSMWPELDEYTIDWYCAEYDLDRATLLRLVFVRRLVEIGALNDEVASA